MTRLVHRSEAAPPPAGTYSQAIEANGLVFLSGQTPRDQNGVRHCNKPFEIQAKMALSNLESVAQAAGLSLRNAVKINVYLRNPADAREFDAIYAEYVSSPPPARTLTQSNFSDISIEVDAVLQRPDE